MHLARFACACGWMLCWSSLAFAEDWPQFRGPNGRATSAAVGLPQTWSSASGLVWKTDLPGPGSSSPIVIGERVFVTCYAGYGVDRAHPGKTEDLKRLLLCIELGTGRIVWQRAVPAAQPEADYVDFMPEHGYATSTPASDGKLVYVQFGKSGVFAFDLAGEQVWHAEIGERINSWGVGASPMLVGDLLIVNAAVESRSILALDKATGQRRWVAKEYYSSWATPVLATARDGRTELVISTLRKLVALDPATGQERWVHKTNLSHAAPSPVFAEGLLYAVDTQPSRLFALRAGGQGKVEDSALVWNTPNVGSGVSSPVLYGDHLYTVERGVFSCVRAATGEVVYRERLSGGAGVCYASPLAADGKVYAVTRENGVYVVAAGAEFKELAVNRFDDDQSVCNATPAVAGSRLLLRSDRRLYCVGK